MASTAYPLPLPSLKLTIGGSDATNFILARTLQARAYLNAQRDTADFEVKSPETYRPGSFTQPVQGQEVIIKLQTGNGPFQLLFGGFISRVAETRVANRVVKWRCQCEDYMSLLTRQLVVKTYVNQNVDTIVKELLATFAPQIVVNANMQAAPTPIQSITFNYEYPAACIDRLAKIVGYDWYIGPDKTFYFYATGTLNRPSPNTISDTSNNFYDLQIEPQLDQVRNRIFVTADQALSGNIIEQFTADGVDHPFQLKHSPVVMSVSTSPSSTTSAMMIDGVPQTVGVMGTSFEDQFAFLVDQDRGTVNRSAQTPVVADGSTVLFTYQAILPVGVMREDQASQRAVAALDGTTYATVVSGDAPLHYYRLDTTSPMIDSAQAPNPQSQWNGTAQGALIDYQIPGALNADLDTAVRFRGSAIQFASGVTVPTSQYSLECWVQVAPDINLAGGIIGWWKPAAGGVYLWAAPTYQLAHSTGALTTLDSLASPTGTRYDHLVASFDGTHGFLWVNGQLLASGGLPVPGTVAVSGIELGNVGYQITPSPLNGSVDEFGVYNYVLSGSQVAAHYLSGRAAGVREQFLNLSNYRVTSFDQARKEANLQLARYASVLTQVTFTSFVSGWQVGDTVTISVTAANTGRMFSGTGLIQQVDFDWIGTQRVQYKVTCLAARYTVIDFLRQLVQPDVPTVLNLIRAPNDQFIMIDGPVTATQQTPPFYVAPDWGTGTTPYGKVGFSIVDIARW